MKIRDRIKSLRRVKASELAPNPRNWRTHPESQRAAMRGVLAEVGYAGAALARETPDGLQLIDGHLRAELDPEGKIPVLVLDVTKEEADKILATFDPLAGMADVDEQALGGLLASIETDSEGLEEMLKGLACDFTEKGENDPNAEWDGMPEFENEDQSGIRAIIHFADEKSMAAFEELLGQKIPRNTKSLWFPKRDRANLKGFTT